MWPLPAYKPLIALSDQRIKPKLFNLHRKGMIFAAFMQGGSFGSEMQIAVIQQY